MTGRKPVKLTVTEDEARRIDWLETFLIVHAARQQDGPVTAVKAQPLIPKIIY